MWDPLAPNPILQGDPEANRRFAGALAAPAKFIVDALKRDATNQKALGRDVAYSLAQKASTPAEAVRTALGPGMQGGPGGLDMVMSAPLIARALRAAPAAENAGIRAYHGSPYDFDRFSMEKIGTGEGAQAYGHGLYFAEKEGIAKSYRDKLGAPPKPSAFEYKGMDVWPNLHNLPPEVRSGAVELHGRMSWYKDPAAMRERTLGELERTLENIKGGHVKEGVYTRREDIENAIKLLRNPDFTITPPTPAVGKMYEVNIRAKPEEFLDWDKPLRDQAAYDPVRRGLGKRMIDATDDMRGSDVVRELQKHYGQNWKVPEARAWAGAPADASTALTRMDIPGIRYLDQGSRPNPERIKRLEEEIRIFEKNAPKDRSDPWYVKTLGDYKTQLAQMRGEGQTSNYVLFRDDIIDILRKYALLPAGVAGAGALGAVAAPDQAQAAPIDPAAIARALREGK